MPLGRNRSRLPDPRNDPAAYRDPREEHYGPAVCDSDRPDYFRIRSKLPVLLFGIPIVALFLGFFLSAMFSLHSFSLVFWVLFALFAVFFNRLNMGVTFDFFPDSVYVYVPELLQLSPYSGRYEVIGENPSELRIRLRNVERLRMRAVERHNVFGLSFLVISLDDFRPGRIWWLSALLHYRQALVLMLKNADADKTMPLLQTYLYFRNA